MTMSSAPPTNPKAEAAVKEVFVFPTSFAQRRLWFLHQLDPNSSIYNITAPLRITAPIDVETLRRSFQEIVRRHETLRTTFTTVDGEPVQVVAPAGNFQLEIIELRTLAESSRAAEVQRLAEAEARRAFSLTQGPLL